MIQKTFGLKERELLIVLKKREIASKGRQKLNKKIKLIITKVGEIQKNVINTYIKLQISMFWIHFLKNIASLKDCVYNFCNKLYYLKNLMVIVENGICTI